MPTIDEVPGPQWGRFTWDCLPGLVSYMTLSAHDLEPRVIVALTRFSAQWICAVPEVATLAGLAPKIWRTANEAPPQCRSYEAATGGRDLFTLHPPKPGADFGWPTDTFSHVALPRHDAAPPLLTASIRPR